MTLLDNYGLGEGSRLTATVTRCDRCEGESTVMNRKGKLIYLYDLSLNLRYEATLTTANNGDSVKCKGEISIKDVATDDTPTFKVSQDESVSTKDAALVTQTLRNEAKAVLMRVVDTLVEEMKTQVDGVQAPSVPTLDAATAQAPSKTSTPATVAAATHGHAESNAGDTVVQCLECDVPANELFAAFVDAQRVQAYTGAPASVEARVSASLSLYGGSVQGEVLACEPGSRLVWRWRAQSWPQGATSTVTIQLEPLDNSRTKLTLTHAQVPRAEVERTKSFWEEQFWTRMRALFGWRMRLL